MGDTQREARQCTAYLGQKLDGHPAVPEEGVGEGSVDGSTRRAVVQQREELRRAVLKVGLSRLSDPTPHTKILVGVQHPWARSLMVTLLYQKRE